MKKLALAVTLTVIPVMIGLAQAPSGPKIILAPPPGPVVWTLRYTYKNSVKSIVESKKEDLAAKSLELSDLTRPEKVRYVIKNPVSSRIVEIEGGAKQEAFYIGNYEFRVSPQKEVLMTDLDSYPSADQLFRKRFPGVSWVKPTLFVRIENAHGEPCAYFRDGNPVKQDPNSQTMDDVLDASKYQVREAWFSVGTGLPVAFKVGEDTGKYTFEQPQAAEVTVPENVREKINEQGKYQAYLKQRNSATAKAP